MHLERIFEHRLAVSKAFNDAAINALEHELADREAAGQQMEVRCLNELMVIDSEIKDIVAKGKKKMEALQKEARELEGAMSAVSSDSALGRGEDDAAVLEHIGNFNFEPGLDSAVSTDNGSSSTDTHQQTQTSCRVEADRTSDDSSIEQDQLDAHIKSETSETNNDAVPIEPDDTPIKNAMELNASVDSIQSHGVDEEAHLGDINLDTPIEANATPDDSSLHSNADPSTAVVHTSPKAEKSTDNKEESTDSKAKSTDNTNDKTAIEKPKLTDKQKEKVLKILGQELKCTLAEYQTSLGISSSSDRIEQLDYMNQVVIKIAEVSGIDLAKTEIEGGIQSWSHTLTESKSASKDRGEKKRSKKRSSKVRRRKSKRDSEPDDGLSETDRMFLASLSSAKFNDNWHT
jgi:hypothetical protein